MGCKSTELNRVKKIVPITFGKSYICFLAQDSGKAGVSRKNLFFSSFILILTYSQLNPLQTAYECLKTGGVLLLPADTGWCLACDARNDAAVQRIQHLKNRSTTTPLTVAVPVVGWLSEHTTQVPDIAWDIIEFAERPLTTVFSNGKNVSPSLLAVDGSIAIRVIRQPSFLTQLLTRFNRTIVLTTVMTAEQKVIQKQTDIPEAIRSQVDYTGEATDTKTAYQAATILRIEVNGEIKFIRKT